MPTPIPEGRLLPIVIDQRAKATPDRVYAITPNTDVLEDGFGETTYGQVARAINKLAWWLDEHLGKCTDAFDAIAYIGPRDLRYVLIVVAAVKTHRKTLVPLSQNSFEAHVNLVDKVQPKALIATPGTMAVWNKISKDRPDIKVLTIPELSELTKDEHVEHYPYSKTWEEAKNDPIHINHTSGTTGLPKPVEFTFCLGYQLEIERKLQAIDPRRNPIWRLFEKQKMLVTMPPEWIAGIAMILHYAVLGDLVPVMLPITAPHPLTPVYVDRVHRAAPRDVTVGFYVPDLLKEMVKTPAYLDNMRHMRTIMYGGAPLDKETGDKLAQTFRLQALIGSTEVGGYAQLQSDPDEWRYYRFDLEHPCGVRMRQYAGDQYELVIERLQGSEDLQHVFKLHPELQVFHTHDLFREHPTKKGLWLYSGRTDDFVKLSNLTKFIARHVEEVIETHPLVRDAVMGGDARPRPFCLIHLAEAANGRDHREVLDEIWSAFEEANKHSAKDIQLSKNMIIFTTPEKPIRKTGKSSINRNATLADYEEEIRALYANAG